MAGVDLSLALRDPQVLEAARTCLAETANRRSTVEEREAAVAPAPRRRQGSLRLKITPRAGQVSVDGVVVGTVAEFDGSFQKLGLDGGGHRIKITAPGRNTIAFDVWITSNELVT